jgi:hypothetical protein
MDKSQALSDLVRTLNSIKEKKQVERDELVNSTIDELKKNLNPSDSNLMRSSFWDVGVASNQEIMDDFNEPQYIEIIPNKFLNNFTLRAIPGHTASGHSLFGKVGSRPNTTIDDVFDAYLEETGIDMYEQSQNEINKVGKAIEKSAYSHPEKIVILESDLFDNPLFNNFSALNFNKGFFYGGNFDNFEGIRKDVSAEFGLSTGGGECELISKKITRELGIDLTEFTSENFKNELLNSLTHEERNKVFKELKLIKPKSKIDLEHVTCWEQVIEQAIDYKKQVDTFQQYIRTRKGGGVSDDLACMGAMYIDFDLEKHTPTPRDVYSLQVGANVADFCDTFTKASSLYVPGGFDQVLADFANHLFVNRIKNDKTYRQECGITNSKLEQILENPEFGLVSKNQLIDIVALVKNPSKSFYEKGHSGKSKSSEQIHSSARYFIKQIEGNNSNSFTLEQEMVGNFIELNNELAIQGHSQIDPLEVLSTNQLISGQTIGFHAQPLKEVLNFYRKNITPILSQPPEQRRELIHKLYSN